MAKDDQEEQYEKLVLANLTRVMDMQKFAEAKNAALLAFSSAWVLGLINLISSGRIQNLGVLQVIAFGIVLFALAAFICMASFLPITHIPKYLISSRPESTRTSFAFFGGIASTPFDDFAPQIQARYKPLQGQSATQAYIDDLHVQLWMNSFIAQRKYRLFNFATGFAVAAIVTLAVVAVSLVKFG